MIDATTIKETRQRYGWTQQQLAEHIGVDRSSVSKWESGVNEPYGPTARLLSMWAKDAPRASGKKKAKK